MHSIFLGILDDPAEAERVAARTRRPTVHPAAKFQWGFIGGLEDNLGEAVSIVNFSPIGSFPKHSGALRLPSRNWSHRPYARDREIGGLNLPLLKQLSRTWLLTRALRRIARHEGGPAVVYVYSLYQPFLSALKRLPRRFRVIAIVPDLPEHYDIGRQRGLRTFLRAINNRLIHRNLARIDGYIVLTSAMLAELGVEAKPSVVMEGIIDPALHPSVPTEETENAILYSGALNPVYGISQLLEAFMALEGADKRLWVCGTGSGVELVKAAAEKDQRIVFKGLLGWEELRNLQSKARLLVNPRRNEGAYTKFSFPSKTMEYLASGRPVAAYRLDGIPEDYGPFVFWLEPTDPPDTASQLEAIMSMPDEDLASFGARAREFVLAEKNRRVQAGKAIELAARL